MGAFWRGMGDYATVVANCRTMNIHSGFNLQKNCPNTLQCAAWGWDNVAGKE
jgi:hypothetical protein